MKFYFYQHQNKSAALIDALRRAGWVSTGPAQAKVIFTDTDHGPMYAPLKQYHQRGKAVFLYPHAARPNLFVDMTEGYNGFKHLSAHFVTAKGHREILQRIDYPHPIEVIGWYLCPILPFQPREDFRKVLFAPIHPNSDGSLSDIDKTLNANTFRRLLPLAESGAIDLTVRYLRGLGSNGLWPVDYVHYIQGKPDQSYQDIDAADVVISHQTFAYIAIARGKPTLMMGENITPRFSSPVKGKWQSAKSFEKYREILQYPLDILAESDTLALLRKSVRSDAEIVDWKKRMIGNPFNPNEFVTKVKKYL